MTSISCSHVLRCFVCICIASYGFSASANSEPQSALGDDVELLQNSLSVSAGQRRFADMGCMPLLHDSISDLKLSNEQVLAELQHANHARQLWENRIAVLETLLPTPKKHFKVEATTSSAPPQREQPEDLRAVKMLLPFIVGCAALCYAVWTAFKYEEEREYHDCPWYHEGPVMTKVLICVAIIWVMVGIFTFTGYFHFSDELRHLSVIESLYLSVQILTTIGYGDLTPKTVSGEIFMVIYVMVGVTLIATLTAEFVGMQLDWELKQVQQFTRVKKDFWRNHQGAITFGSCLLFGTIFYGSLAGEEKTYFEAFYMSVITLTTVGFGHYTPITSTGQLVGSVWMVVGWVSAAQTIASIGENVFSHRRRIRTKAAAMMYYDDLREKNIAAGRNSAMDRADFLGFELLRSGFSTGQIERANSRFAQIDEDKSWNLDYDEFENYVDTLFADVKYDKHPKHSSTAAF